MVMGLRYDPNKMTYMRKDKIYTIYTTKNASGYIATTSHRFLKLLSYFGSKFARDSWPGFWNKWSWGFCVVPLQWLTWESMVSTHYIPQQMNLGTISQPYITFWDFEIIFGIPGVNLQDPAGPSFEINGHGASVWYHNNDLHRKG